MVKDKTSLKKAGPIIPDCIDLQIEVTPVPFADLSKAPQGETSAEIRRRVVQARARQQERFKNYAGVHCNAQMETRLLRRFATPDAAGLALLEGAMRRYDLSARAYERILKVARTIADLAGSDNVTSDHLAEAIGYRNLDRSDWAETGL